MPERDPRYDDARRYFDKLDVEEQAQFLVEATASALAHGVLRMGKALAEGLEDVLHDARRSSSSRSRGPGPAEPETAQRQTPRSGPVSDDAP